MKTYRYKDAFGFTYDVPEDRLEEFFERRRGILLKIAIVGQILLLLGAILAFAWTNP